LRKGERGKSGGVSTGGGEKAKALPHEGGGGGFAAKKGERRGEKGEIYQDFHQGKVKLPSLKTKRSPKRPSLYLPWMKRKKKKKGGPGDAKWEVLAHRWPSKKKKAIGTNRTKEEKRTHSQRDSRGGR